MTLHPEHEIESGTQASQLESTGVVLNIAEPNNAGEGSQLPHKRTNSPDIHETKRHRGNSTAKAKVHKKQRTEVLSRYGASYRVDRNGSGIFTLNQQTGMTAQGQEKVRVERA
jgi:hypothetical protein